ncbi:NAD-dependent deacylase [Heliorestis acidaminivorans]|uniref:protein acetyllysine N-acetyltransferase n=1 Tax=Heliorestis acidaminivorans TaxID=553427 RepID=A0A6I0EWG4_9FIRM|nr:NAD-dependent deacylase [Heliorestis acidaminivorans]KAB2952395.1 NAD-dependent deacylase [Heliorestis acidaminivorans]
MTLPLDQVRKIKECAKHVQSATRIAVLSGAGISTESGIPDFRSTDGLWQNSEVREAITRSCFSRQPERFYYYFSQLFLSWSDIKPNQGHQALADLEKKLGKWVGIATQNIDGLHQEAGSTNIVELHGNLRYAVCQKCGTTKSMNGIKEKIQQKIVPLCDCGGILKPKVVLFGDPLDMQEFRKAQVWMSQADLIFCLGSSLTVTPANTLLSHRRNDSTLVIINLEPTVYDEEADFLFQGLVGEILPVLVSYSQKVK